MPPEIVRGGAEHVVTTVDCQPVTPAQTCAHSIVTSTARQIVLPWTSGGMTDEASPPTSSLTAQSKRRRIPAIHMSVSPNITAMRTSSPPPGHRRALPQKGNLSYVDMNTMRTRTHPGGGDMNSVRVEHRIAGMVWLLSDAGWPQSSTDMENALRRVGIAAIPAQFPGIDEPAYVVPELNGGHLFLSTGGENGPTGPSRDVRSVSIMAEIDAGEDPESSLARLHSGLSSLGHSLDQSQDTLSGEIEIDGRTVRCDCGSLVGWGGRTDSCALFVNVSLV